VIVTIYMISQLRTNIAHLKNDEKKEYVTPISTMGQLDVYLGPSLQYLWVYPPARTNRPD
jgi:hypothetical protein